MTVSINDTDLDVWAERDRVHIALKWAGGEFKDGETIAEWWDEDALQMFEDGFFSSDGVILGKLINPRPLHTSVFKYCEERGLLAKPPFVVCRDCDAKLSAKRITKKDRTEGVQCVECVRRDRMARPDDFGGAGWRADLRRAERFEYV